MAPMEEIEMFDVLLSLMALGNAAIEVKTIKAAYNAPYKGDTCFLYDEKPCFEEESPCATPIEEKPKRQKINLEERRKRFNEMQRQKEINKHTPKEEEETNPIIQWVFDHDELILNILQKPGKHIIKNEDFEGINKELIADFLFEQNNIESVEIISDGLEVISR